MLLFRSKRAEHIAQYVHEEDPTITGTPGEMWKKYLASKHGTGDTFYDLEQSYLQWQSMSSWDQFLSVAGFTIGSLRERLRAWLVSVLNRVFYIAQESGDKLVLEDISGTIRLE